MKLKDWHTLEPCEQQDCEHYNSGYDYNCNLNRLHKCDMYYPASLWREDLYKRRAEEENKLCTGVDRSGTLSRNNCEDGENLEWRGSDD